MKDHIYEPDFAHPSLFDNPNEEEELTISGNEDTMDGIKKICFFCGGVNGCHRRGCEGSS